MLYAIHTYFISRLFFNLNIYACILKYVESYRLHFSLIGFQNYFLNLDKGYLLQNF